MKNVELFTIICHTTTDSIGMISNSILLLLVLFQTPRHLSVYAILMGNAAVVDFFACASSLLTQSRVIPAGTSLIYFSNGPCRMIGAEFCYVTYTVMLSCYTHSLYSLLYSFYFRYYVLKRPQPSPSSVKLCIALISIPSILQFVIISSDNHALEQLIPILKKRFPQYNLVGETISGHTSVFEWRLLTSILHMTVPVTPIYICILVLRRRIIAMLSTDLMSPYTKRIHSQLLKAITYQALLPGFFFLGVLSYVVGQLGLCNDPVLESFTFLSIGLLPTLSPLLTLHFVRPYRKYLLSHLFGVFKKTSATSAKRTAISSAVINGFREKETEVQ